VFDEEEIAALRNEKDADQPNIWLPEDALPGFRKAQMEYFNVRF
jgi:hypothetical protein